MSRRTPNGNVADQVMQDVSKKDAAPQEKQVRTLALDNGHFSMLRYAMTSDTLLYTIQVH